MLSLLFQVLIVNFIKKMKNAKASLYPSCTKFTKMSATVALYKHKALSGWSDKSCSDLLELLHDILSSTMLSRNLFMMLTWDIKRFMHV